MKSQIKIKCDNRNHYPYVVRLDNDTRELIKAEANYMIQTQCTIRQVAQKFKRSKTAVHSDLTQLLPFISPEISAKVRIVLNKNLKEAPHRGGIATQKLFQKIKVKKS